MMSTLWKIAGVNALDEIRRRLFRLSIAMLMICVLTLVAQPVQMQEGDTHSLIAYLSNGDLIIMRPDGLGTQILAVSDWPVIYDDPAWSPDGSALAYIMSPSGLDQVFVANTDLSDPRQLTHDDLEYKFTPRWSPDGQWIAFTYARSPDGDIYMVRPDGTELHNITNTPESDERLLDWSPDGQTLAVRVVAGTGEEGQGTVVFMRPDGTNAVPQSQFPARTTSVRFSPDGSRLALAVRVRTDFLDSDVFVMNSDGTGLENLASSESNDFDPTWSPDGQFIAFSSNRTGDYDIYRMRADGSELTNISNRPESGDYRPDWSPLLPGPAPTAGPPTLTPIPVTLTPSALECADAPPSRLNLGMSAAVVLPTEQEPERQNLRVRDAAEGEPIGLLEPGKSFRIVGGPECGAAGQRWWEIETLDGSVRGWSVEGFAPDDYLMVPF